MHIPRGKSAKTLIAKGSRLTGLFKQQ